MSPRLVLGRENVPCVAEVVNRSPKADCTDFTFDSQSLFELSFLITNHRLSCTQQLVNLSFILNALHLKISLHNLLSGNCHNFLEEFQ